MSLQENLIRLRKERGLSQEALAEMIGISRQAVSKWETGDAAPDIYNLMALADALDVSMDALCGRERKQPEAAVQSQPHAAPQKKIRFPWVVLAVVAVFLLCLYFYTKVSWYTGIPATGLPETVYLDGYGFGSQQHPSGDTAVVSFDFLPQVGISPDLGYGITFTPVDPMGEPILPAFHVENGQVFGSVELKIGTMYEVIGRVTKGAESREFYLTRNLMVTADGVRFTPEK